VRPSENLELALRLLDAAQVRPDFLLLTGDLADLGDEWSYRELKDLVDGAEVGKGATIVYLPGNHDDRQAFRSHLLGTAGGTEPINQVHWSDGLRIISLDSSVPGQDPGALEERTIKFLSDELATRAPEGTLLAIHHPPIPSPIEPMARMALAEPENLAEVIAGSDIHMVLCGHYHHELLGMLGATPVWVSPAVSYRADMTSLSVFRPAIGSAVSRIEVDEKGARASVIRVL